MLCVQCAPHAFGCVVCRLAVKAEGTELVWRQGYYEPLGGTPARFATAPLCVDALSRARLRSKRVHKHQQQRGTQGSNSAMTGARRGTTYSHDGVHSQHSAFARVNESFVLVKLVKL